MPVQGWKNYERQVMRQFLRRRPYAAIEWDAKIFDVTGLYQRQIDVWLPGTREIVECKHHSSPVGMTIVDQLVGVARDVNASAVHILSSSGFSPNALARAQKEKINCVTFPFEKHFEEPIKPTGHGYYSGEYFEVCLCSTPSNPAGDTYGRISYFDADGDDFWPLCASLSVDWVNSKTKSFVAFIMLGHKLGAPPPENCINEFVDCYGDRFTEGYEWIISEEEVAQFAEHESFDL